jgi:hypothetical protein
MWPFSVLRERARQRRAAGAWLLWQTPPRPPSSELDRRRQELVSVRRRALLARTLHGIEREALGRVVPGPVPLNRRAIRAQLGLVQALEERLADQARPVSAPGVLLVDRLLTEPGSPLYSRDADAVLAGALSEALAALEPRTERLAA